MIDAREFKTTSVHNIDPRYIPAGPANEMQFLSSSESFTKKFTGASEIMARLLLWLFWWCPSYLPAVPGPFGRKTKSRTAKNCSTLCASCFHILAPSAEVFCPSRRSFYPTPETRASFVAETYACVRSAQVAAKTLSKFNQSF